MLGQASSFAGALLAVRSSFACSMGARNAWSHTALMHSSKQSAQQPTSPLSLLPCMQVGAIHAGLECGILGEKFPGMDMVGGGAGMHAAQGLHKASADGFTFAAL